MTVIVNNKSDFIVGKIGSSLSVSSMQRQFKTIVWIGMYLTSSLFSIPELFFEPFFLII